MSVDIAAVLQLVLDCVMHLTHERPNDGVHCQKPGCILMEQSHAFNPIATTQVIREVSIDQIAQTVGCPRCGFEYSTIPRYALVTANNEPLLYSDGRVVTGSKEEIDLMLNERPGLKPFELLSLRERTALLRRDHAHT